MFPPRRIFLGGFIIDNDMQIHDKKILRLSSSLMLAILISCETPIPLQDAIDNEIVINSILIAGNSEQYLLMTMPTKSIGDSLQYVQDARIEVNGVLFMAIPANLRNPQTPYNWVAPNLKIACGQLCSLRVFYKEKVIRGQTVAPASLEPVIIKNDTIRWRGDPSHYGYSVRLNEAYFGHIGGTYFDFRFNFPAGRYFLQILAFDRNYQYQQALSTTNGLDGAYGLFASACAWKDSVDLK